MFARMREDINIGINALIMELLNTGKERGHLKLKLEIELNETQEVFMDACSNLHCDVECRSRISWRLTSKTEPVYRMVGIFSTLQ